MKKFSCLLLFLTASYLTAAPNGALAIPITGGQTEVSVTAFDLLTGVNVTPEPLGTATIDAGTTPPTAIFPITGGNTEGPTGGAVIEHTGSGLELVRPTNRLRLEDFVIDTGLNTLTGEVTATPGTGTLQNVPLFTLTMCDSLTCLLILTEPASDALNQAFGTGNLAGTVFGTATVNFQTQAVPEPGSLLLLGAGIFGVLALRRIG